MAVGWLAVLLPGFCRLVDWLELFAVGRALGAEYMMASSYTGVLWSYATIFNSVAVSLALVACGMSMVYKRLSGTDCQL